jgi:N-terminal domain of galactosyltransferase
LPYNDLFGGAVAIEETIFEEINGFSNQFYGKISQKSLPGCFVNLSFRQFSILLICHFINLLFHLLASLSTYRFIDLLYHKPHKKGIQFYLAWPSITLQAN